MGVVCACVRACVCVCVCVCYFLVRRELVDVAIHSKKLSL